MFIQEQMPKLAEMNDEMQDFATELTAQIAPITSIYTHGSTMADYVLQVAQWYDVINCLLFV